MKSDPPDWVPRHAAPRIGEALADTRVVAIVGPRQSGKTTLARSLAVDGRTYLTLDDEQTRSFARDDPTGFVRALDRAAIDEIQRAPALLLAIKRSVDEDRRPGRFLVTGSADLFAGSIAPDSLAGRVETIELLPLSQAEQARAPAPSCVEQCFAGRLAPLDPAGPTPDLVQRVLAGGYPEVLARSDPARRRRWLLAYAQALATRDVPDIATIGRIGALPLLLEHAALAAGQLLNLAQLGARIGVDGKTADRWLRLLETIFVVRRLRPWHRNGIKRLVKTPKMHFLDSGLLAALTNVDAARVASDRTALGPLVETFVHAELAKALALTIQPTTMHHYRDKDQLEIDFVLERSPGRVVGIEVKAAATVRADDFRALARLRDALGSAFAMGAVLHDGEQVMNAGDRLYAAPFAALWQG